MNYPLYTFLTVLVVCGTMLWMLPSEKNFGAAVNISATGTSTLPNGLNLTTGCLTKAGGACIGGISGFFATSSSMGATYNGGTPAVGTMTGYCPSGQSAIGGGFVLNSASAYVTAMTLSADTIAVTANANNNGSTAQIGSIYLRCVTP